MAGGTTGTGGTAALPEDWFDPAWTQRRKLEVSDPELTEELVAFQVPLRLDTQSFDYAGAQPVGEDIRFVTPDGLVLKHEIETWDPAGESLIWLLLPTLSAAPLEVWLYSGNSLAAAMPEEDRRAVWPGLYSAVWHLGGDINDASPSAYGAEGTGVTFTEAKLGQGVSLSRPDKQYAIISLTHPFQSSAALRGPRSPRGSVRPTSMAHRATAPTSATTGASCLRLGAPRPAITIPTPAITSTTRAA